MGSRTALTHTISQHLHLAALRDGEREQIVLVCSCGGVEVGSPEADGRVCCTAAGCGLDGSQARATAPLAALGPRIALVACQPVFGLPSSTVQG
uniref:Uncharacterized protein n=1 Tax=Knipowitschia caucasica TaxID=637954 RepID=A0AAV2K092_KNICA